MLDKQEEQLKEMCITMLNLLDKMRSTGEISESEYKEHTQMKKKFLNFLEQKSLSK